MVSLGMNGDLWVLFHKCSFFKNKLRNKSIAQGDNEIVSYLRETCNYSKQGANERLLI